MCSSRNDWVKRRCRLMASNTSHIHQRRIGESVIVRKFMQRDTNSGRTVGCSRVRESEKRHELWFYVTHMSCHNWFINVRQTILMSWYSASVRSCQLSPSIGWPFVAHRRINCNALSSLIFFWRALESRSLFKMTSYMTIIASADRLNACRAHWYQSNTLTWIDLSSGITAYVLGHRVFKNYCQ